MSKKKTKKILISLNEFLATHSRKRNLDKTIKGWYDKKYRSHENRSIEDWQKVIHSFYNESELK